MITIVGMGPGSTEYITPVAHRTAAEADILFGGKRWLNLFAESASVKFDLKPFSRLIATLRDHKDDKRIAVLVGGDPCLFSLLGTIKRELPTTQVHVIPGISAVQVLFARLNLDLSSVDIISLHGRPIDNLKKPAKSGARLCIYSDATNSPMKIGRMLLEHNLDGKAVVGENLASENERISHMAFAELAFFEAAPLSVVYAEID